LITASYNDSIFINCPFDDDYAPLLRALVYTIYRCGFAPRSTLEEDDGSDIRVDKIARLIDKCKTEFMIFPEQNMILKRVYPDSICHLSWEYSGAQKDLE
jgi:hypothetical protein